jgi:hypothetical protein
VENDSNGVNGLPGGGPTTQSVPIGYVPTRPGVFKEFNTTTVVKIACRTARYVVRIDGVPYAGFEEKFQATDAMHAWRIRWPAVKYASLDVAPNY